MMCSFISFCVAPHIVSAMGFFILRPTFWLAIGLGTQDVRIFPLRPTFWLVIGLGTQDDRFCAHMLVGDQCLFLRSSGLESILSAVFRSRVLQVRFLLP